MNKIILQAKNETELKELIKKNITLAEDESYVIKELKKPFKLLFLEFKGKYEILILKKSEITELNKKTKEKEVKETIKENPKKVLKETNKDTENSINERIKNVFEGLVKATELNIKIKRIEENGNIRVIHIEGKDVRYFIGEKGIALTSIESLLNSIKEFKNYKIQIDSNDYKAKREETLRVLAQKKAEKVLNSKTVYKLSPMSARERKIIHEEVSKYQNLKTESYGEEPKRYLVIKYVEKKED